MKIWPEFFILECFCFSFTTTTAMDRRGLQFYSVYRKGPDTPLEASLIIGWWCCTRGWRTCVGGILYPQTFEMFWLPLQQLLDPWTMSQLDSVGQKGPEISLKGVLIVVKGWFMAESWNRRPSSHNDATPHPDATPDSAAWTSGGLKSEFYFWPRIMIRRHIRMWYSIDMW